MIYNNYYIKYFKKAIKIYSKYIYCVKEMPYA